MTVPDRWAERQLLVARFIPPDSRVLDLGAGAGMLRDRLPDGCSYTGLDLPEFNMNTGRWPEGEWDVAVMSGVLEYARFPAAVFRHLAELAPLSIVTYSHGGRRDATWVSDLSEDELAELATKAGFASVEIVALWHHRHLHQQAVWRLAR